MKQFILLLLLSACTSQQNWTYREVSSKHRELESAYLRFSSDNELTGLSVELLQSAIGTTAYISVHSRKIPLFQGQSDQAVVVLEIDKEQILYQAHRMEGGQRLLLSQEATEQLLQTFSENKAIKIYLEGYHSTLELSKMCRKFMKGCSWEHL